MHTKIPELHLKHHSGIDDTAMADTAPQRASLLGLPPELRDRIYHELFHSHGDFNIQPTGYVEPAILRTSKHLRKEARGPFYAETDFALWHVDYDPSIAVRFARRCFSLRNQGPIQHSSGVDLW